MTPPRKGWITIILNAPPFELAWAAARIEHLEIVIVLAQEAKADQPS